MNNYFKSIFSKQPVEIIGEDYFYNSDIDGDCCDDEDAIAWLNGGIFEHRWKDVRQQIGEVFCDSIINSFSKNPSPFLEIACGPGMGLTPLILSNNPDTTCLATDACSLLIKSWRKYINKNLKKFDINLASFSALDIPIKDNSLETITSFIGISSTRAGEQGKIKSIQEVYRILKNGGRFIAIENEWTDYDAIYKVFDLWGKPVWSGMQKEKSWETKFLECGFSIEANDKTFFRSILKDDNDLGEQAHKFGIDIGIKFTMFELCKRSN